MKEKLTNFSKTLGPGILFASTAIGVSHLVQSTKAGAEYGFALLVFILAANFFKWPFFEFGSRYAAATGKTLIDGYFKLGKVVLLLYLAITALSMFFVTAAVIFVAAGFMQNLIGFQLAPQFYFVPSAVLFSFCVVILGIGKYAFLDKSIKFIGTVMLISTVFAFFISLINGPVGDLSYVPFTDLVTVKSIPFIIALMGWMPTAVDLSTWNSIWTIERIKQSGFKPSVKETIFEFNLGYWISAVLSVCFLVLGAFLIFGTGKLMPESNAAFASEVVSLYTANLGSWTWIIISSAGFSIMLGTCLGVLDGYARAISRTMNLLVRKDESKRNYVFWLVITSLGGFSVIAFFISEFILLVQVATTISFLVAPVIAYLNYRLVFGSELSEKDRPGMFLKVTAISGIVFLTAFSLIFVWEFLRF